MTDDDVRSPVLLACRRVAAAMDLFDEAAARALGVGRSDLRALNLLEDGPLSHTEIGRRLGLTRAGVTGLVDRLAAAGYVTRRAAPDDRRTTLVALEPATFRAFASVYRPLGERVGAVVAGAPDRDQRLVAETLEAMAEAFDAARGSVAGS